MRSPNNSQGSGRSSTALAQALRSGIVSGQYRVGSFLPPIRELSTAHGVSRETARRGMKVLEAEHLVASVPGHGFRVMGRANDPERDCPIGYVTSHSEETAGDLHGSRMLGVVLQEAAAAREWSVLGMHMGGLSAQVVAERLRAARVGGLVLDSLDQELTRLVQKLGIPVVTVNAWSEGLELDAVLQDNYRGGFLAATELASRGLTRIAWLGHAWASCHRRERYGGVMAGLLSAGLDLPPELRVHTNATGAREKARALLARRDRPEALVVLWADLAGEVKKAADDLGLVIGRDFQMIGWSAEEIYESDYLPRFAGGPVPPAITWKTRSMAETALGRLAERRANPGLEPIRISVPTRLRFAVEDKEKR